MHNYFSWRKSLIVLLISIGGVCSYAQTELPSSALDALFKHDLGALHNVYRSSTAENKAAIETALYGPLINLDELTYEQLKTGISGPEDEFSKIVERHLIDKENEIIKEISLLTIEELKDYSNSYKERKPVVDTFLTSVVKPSVDHVSYVELSYLHQNLPNLSLGKNLEARSAEKAEMVKDRVRDYCRFEKSHTDILIDLVKIACMQYLNSNYKNVAKTYSKIGIVPDNVTSIDKQFRTIVNECLKSQEMKKQLMSVVNKYCAVINEARAEYAKEANITDYPLMSIDLPAINGFAYRTDNGLLSKIPAARKDFVDSRETAGTVATIASFFVGNLVSNIGKGLYDMYAVGELADKEIEARKNIVSDSYKQLNNHVTSYANSLADNIRKQIDSNQAKFINHVSSKK